MLFGYFALHASIAKKDIIVIAMVAGTIPILSPQEFVILNPEVSNCHVIIIAIVAASAPKPMQHIVKRCFNISSRKRIFIREELFETLSMLFMRIS
jgi:hypothetical protein